MKLYITIYWVTSKHLNALYSKLKKNMNTELIHKLKSNIYYYISLRNSTYLSSSPKYKFLFNQ